MPQKALSDGSILSHQAWLKRQRQWDQFHRWERTSPPLPLSDEELLRLVGEAVDMVRRTSGMPDLSEWSPQGIIRLRKALALIRRPI